MMFETWVISLKRNAERRNWMKSVLKRAGLPFSFVDAIEGKDISDKLASTFYKNTDFHEWSFSTRGMMGHFESHMSLLRYSKYKNKNLLILKDDVDFRYKKGFDWNNVDFNSFDVYMINNRFPVSSASYFVSAKGAISALNHFNNITITQAIDHEFAKATDFLDIKEGPKVFWHTGKFASDIAPDGYRKLNE